MRILPVLAGLDGIIYCMSQCLLWVQRVVLYSHLSILSAGMGDLRFLHSELRTASLSQSLAVQLYTNLNCNPEMYITLPLASFSLKHLRNFLLGRARCLAQQLNVREREKSVVIHCYLFQGPPHLGSLNTSQVTCS